MTSSTGPEPAERMLAERFRAGDETVLREVWDRYGGAVHQVGAACLPSPHDAEDVTAATFVTAWRGRADYDPGRATLAGWLLGIARRQAADRLRASGRAHDGGPGQVVDRLLVLDELQRLGAEQRQVVELAFFDDLTPAQIGGLTGLPPATVRHHLRYGLGRLKTRWEVDGAARGPGPTGVPRPR